MSGESLDVSPLCRLQFELDASEPVALQVHLLDMWLEQHPPSQWASSSMVHLVVTVKGSMMDGREARQAWEQWEGEKTLEVVNQLSVQFGVRGGQWRCWAQGSRVDEVWNKVVKLMISDCIGSVMNEVKVSAAASDHVGYELFLHIKDYTDTAQVHRVESMLRSAGLNEQLRFEPDIFAILNIGKDFQPTIFPSIWHFLTIPSPLTEGCSQAGVSAEVSLNNETNNFLQ